MPHRNPLALPRALRIVRKRGRYIQPIGDAVYVGRPTLWGNPFTGRCPLSSRWCHADTLLDLAPRYAFSGKASA